ncbi:MAG: ATP-binding protein, partial [Candidatus Marsarchaeota archaeon]|nr:ATP-binding protein [Candidatus Marsarchaeota archaeon]
MATIKEALQNFNPWWSSKEIKITFSNRHVYHEIKKFIASKQIIALSGLRRVGKTTIMLKLAEELMKKDYLPENVIYFSFDEFKDAEISAIIKTYEEMSEKNLRSGKFLVLFDEVQKLNDWQNQLKTVYDLYGSSVKLVISGSESLFIRRKSKESLAGRIFEFRVEPLSFTEFLSFKKFNPKPIGMHEKELAKLLDKYILTQGFPELVDEENKDYIKKYINEGIVEKVVYSDIPKLFKISDLTVLESVLRPLLEEPGQLIELSNWSKELGISRQTLSLYLRYLEESFIVKKLYNFSKSRRKTERRLKKYYPAVVSEDLLFRQDDISRSHAFEWIVI